jgi:site-specific recombinase XerD
MRGATDLLESKIRILCTTMADLCMARLRQLAGLSLHVLRHTSGTHAVASGRSLGLVQTLLGSVSAANNIRLRDR